MSAGVETSSVVTAVTTVQVRGGAEGTFAGWLTRFNSAIAAFDGYISAVVIPPVPPTQSDWVMVQRFQTMGELRGWLDSEQRRSLLDEGRALLVDEGTTNVIEGSSKDLSPNDMVTEIITVTVKPGKEDEYREWVDRIRQIEARFPGYQGLQLQPPIPGLQENWVSLLRFDTAEHLNAWLESEARQEALREVEEFVEQREQQVASAFSGWFAFGDAPGKTPPSWKQSMIVLLTLYPIVMLELLFLNPITNPLGLPEATFIGNAISVAATGFILIPLALRAFEWWLLPRGRDSAKQEFAGIALIVGLYILSIVAFSWFV